MTHPYLVRSDWKTCIRCGVRRRVGGRRGDGGLCRDCHQTDPKFPYYADERRSTARSAGIGDSDTNNQKKENDNDE